MPEHAIGSCVTVDAYFSKVDPEIGPIWDSNKPRVETVKILEQREGYNEGEVMYWVALPETPERECFMYEACYV